MHLASLDGILLLDLEACQNCVLLLDWCLQEQMKGYPDWGGATSLMFDESHEGSINKLNVTNSTFSILILTRGGQLLKARMTKWAIAYWTGWVNPMCDFTSQPSCFDPAIVTFLDRAWHCHQHASLHCWWPNLRSIICMPRKAARNSRGFRGHS